MRNEEKSRAEANFYKKVTSFYIYPYGPFFGDTKAVNSEQRAVNNACLPWKRSAIPPLAAVLFIVLCLLFFYMTMPPD